MDQGWSKRTLAQKAVKLMGYFSLLEDQKRMMSASEKLLNQKVVIPIRLKMAI